MFSFSIDFDQLFHNPYILGNSQPNLTSGQANRDNVRTIQVESSYKESDIKIDFLPRLIIDKCENQNILELEFLHLVDETTAGMCFVTSKSSQNK